MTKISYVLAALLAATILACVVLAYLWIDRAISLSYARQDAESANKSIHRLERLLENEWQGMSEDQVLQKLQKTAAQMTNPIVIIKKEDGVIWFDETRFNLQQGKLQGVGELGRPD